MPDSADRPASRARATSILQAVARVLLLAVAAGACTGPGSAGGVPAVRIGAASTAEQDLLAAIAAEAVTRAGAPVEVVDDLGDTTDLRDAALDGRIDAYWDYSGSAWTRSLGRTAPPVDAMESFEAVAVAEADAGLRWLGPSGVDARLAFFTRAGATGEEEPTLSWLARTIGAEGGTVCADPVYLSSPAGLAYLAEVYALSLESVGTSEAEEPVSLQRTEEGDCLAGLAAATAPVAVDLDLQRLRDDQGVFPALALAPVVDGGGRADVPAVTEALVAVAEALTTDRLAALTAAAAAGGALDELAAVVADEAGL